MNLTTLATCNLNQWAMDFDGNLKRIIESIEIAKARGAKYRLGPELEITGYGCADHFYEGDTMRHSWEAMGEILTSGVTDGILCDIGMPVMHRNVRYNCRVFVLDGKILLLRPKMDLANDGLYREMRWFTPWPHRNTVHDYTLPRSIQAITGQITVPIGDGAISTRDTVVGVDLCEEMFTPASPNIYLGLNGVEILGNGSGSHHQLRKLHRRIDLMKSATSRNGGIYLYANQQGCDGGRMYFDGCALIIVNGEVVAQGSQFSPKDVEVVTATVDLEDIRVYRGAFVARMHQASKSEMVPRVFADFDLTYLDEEMDDPIARAQPVKYHTPEEEIALGPACWLWDYLRRSGAGGFFLPLSGGADSSAVAAIVGSMCQLVMDELKEDDAGEMLAEVRGVVGDDSFVPASAEELASHLFYTCFMATENSSAETRRRAAAVAKEVGANHSNINIDGMVAAMIKMFTTLSGKTPRYKVHGGSHTENLALQNIQARLRMVSAYLLAQLMPWVRGNKGFLLVLGTSNVDEALRGYMTKYDASSADVNPIGSISKGDLKRFLVWAADNLGYETLREVAGAAPTAELEPITETYSQKDEVDMGMTYDELGIFGRLRKVNGLGPVAMFERLVYEWDHLSPAEVAEKVKRFFRYYAINRHKMTTLTPSYHAESYSPDDNRFDLRQFLYNTRWTWQFKKIDEIVERLNTSD